MDSLPNEILLKILTGTIKSISPCPEFSNLITLLLICKRWKDIILENEFSFKYEIRDRDIWICDRERCFAFNNECLHYCKHCEIYNDGNQTALCHDCMNYGCDYVFCDVDPKSQKDNYEEGKFVLTDDRNWLFCSIHCLNMQERINI